MEVRQCNLAFLFLVNLYLNCLSLGRYFQVFVSAKCSSAFYIFAGHAGVCPTTKRPPFCIKPKIIYNCQVDTDCQGHEKCCLDPCDKSCVPRKLCKYFMYQTLANISKVSQETSLIWNKTELSTFNGTCNVITYTLIFFA